MMQNPSDSTADAEQAGQTFPAQAPAAARTVFRLLAHMKTGSMDVQWPDGTMTHVGQPGAEPRAAVRLHDWRVCGMVLKSGDIGFAESYLQGDWSTPDLTALIRVLIANRDHIESVIYGHWVGRLVYRVRHWMNRNTKSNSRKNIHAHYDLGNAFYRLWLDGTMNYSSAWFGGDLTQPLTQAQNAKVARALTQAGVLGGAPGQRVLEIGCGWGALAEMAARDAQAQVVGVTLSTEQLDWAKERCARLNESSGAGHTDMVDLRLQDYRDINDAPFDAVLSIEMFEAVGQAYWPSYFATVSRLLKPQGRACIQTITIRDDLFERYSRSSDFIQQYIFPGGMLPSDAQFRAQAAKAGLRVVEAADFGPDYAETLRRWHEAFKRHQKEVRAQKFDERFMRIWEFYLCYCEAAFDMRNTSVVQYTLMRDPA